MVSIHPKLDKWQHQVPEKNREYCRYCKAKPELIYLLTRTQDHICESCFKQYDRLLSNDRAELPINNAPKESLVRYTEISTE
jgi:hypothetical protein